MDGFLWLCAGCHDARARATIVARYYARDNKAAVHNRRGRGDREVESEGEVVYFKRTDSDS